MKIECCIWYRSHSLCGYFGISPLFVHLVQLYVHWTLCLLMYPPSTCFCDDLFHVIAGKLFPYHFVRPQDKDVISRFCEDVNSKRLSITTPFEGLQKSKSRRDSETELKVWDEWRVCFTQSEGRVMRNGTTTELCYIVTSVSEIRSLIWISTLTRAL